MKLTDEQFAALQPYEKHFETMIRSKWARHPGSAALDLIHGIYVQVTGVNLKLNKGCSHCIMNLLSDMGQIYFADKQERIDRENDKIAVELSQETPEVVKAKVKTPRKPRKPKTQD